MDWARDLPDWPLHAHSRQVRSKPHVWHVQEIGQGPEILFLHGAGGSTHSWAEVMTHLEHAHRVIAIDLPGQGFTRAGTKTRCSLTGMSHDIHTLIASQDWHPKCIVGHSAGAAVALELAERLDSPCAVVGLNAALERFDGIAGWLFPVMAKMMALNPFTALAVTMGGDPVTRARSLIKTTGSRIPEASLQCYARLFSDREHVDSTLQMMARWDIDMLAARLMALNTPTLLLYGDKDGTVPPRVSLNAAATMPNARAESLGDLGHLAHEETPARVADRISSWMDEVL